MSYSTRRYIGRVFWNSVCICMLSLSLGFLLNDLLRGYLVVAFGIMWLRFSGWVQEEYRYL